jgi:hypothetical protein
MNESTICIPLQYNLQYIYVQRKTCQKIFSKKNNLFYFKIRKNLKQFKILKLYVINKQQKL